MNPVQGPIATKEAITEWLVKWISNALGVPAAEIETDKSLLNYSLSSVTAMMLVGDLEELLGLTLPPTLVWDFPSIDAIADNLLEQIVPPVAAESPGAAGALKSGDHPGGSSNGTEPVASLDDMSDQEVTALLNRLITEESTRAGL